MYRIIKTVLFRFDPEKIHHWTVNFILLFSKIPGFSYVLEKCFALKDKRLERTVFGITFPNPVGLAAGFDKNASFFQRFFSFGFGFIEIGTLTPKAQDGNSKPRMFRLKKDKAIINRMGFNNEGAARAAIRLKTFRKPGMVIGGNIGKNKDTPNDLAIKDYELSFEELFPVVDYFVINVSSPNTPGLRELQDKEPLKALLIEIQALNQMKPIQKPVLLKIAPDLSESQLDDIIDIVLLSKIAGVIATNTTLSREHLSSEENLIEETGGLSGRPLRDRSTEVIAYLHKKSGGAFPIIGVGGIHTAQDALDKLRAGASLVQLYTGFIYEGPALIKKINKAILKSLS